MLSTFNKPKTNKPIFHKVGFNNFMLQKVFNIKNVYELKRRDQIKINSNNGEFTLI